MQKLLKDIKSIDPEVMQTIESRLVEFDSFKDKKEEEWFSELCFCILTANSRAKTALAIQSALGPRGFLTLSQEQLVKTIKDNKHRFHNTKASRIVEARQHKNIKSTIQDIVNSQGQIQARDWLVKNVKGLGLKESSHFLRNTGHTNLAIIDRHIINLFKQHSLLNSNFIVKNAVSYLQVEQVCEQLSSKINMNLSKLDLCLWYLKTGEVLK